MTWEHFLHVADIGLHGRGHSEAEAFEQTALALTAVITDPATVRPNTAIEIACQAPDHELLLVDWLNALIYEMDIRGMLFSRFAVTLTGDHLTATAWGEPVDRDRHHPAVEVKGATYTELKVYRDGDGVWHARCVVDV